MALLSLFLHGALQPEMARKQPQHIRNLRMISPSCGTGLQLSTWRSCSHCNLSLSPFWSYLTGGHEPACSTGLPYCFLCPDSFLIYPIGVRMRVPVRIQRPGAQSLPSRSWQKEVHQAVCQTGSRRPVEEEGGRLQKGLHLCIVVRSLCLRVSCVVLA